MFDRLTETLQTAFKKLRGKGLLNEKAVDEGLREIRRALLDADVNFKVAKKFTDNIRERAVGEEVMKSLTPGQQLIKIVRDELVHLLGDTAVEPNVEKGRMNQFLLLGLQGSGKTTACAKLALNYKKDGYRPLLVPLDVYRPAAIKQLEVVGSQAGVDVFKIEEGGIPLEIMRQAYQFAKDKGYSLVIYDTAGRTTVDDEMMNEVIGLRKELQFEEVFLVIDSMTGQDAVTTATKFNESVGITGCILTKLDGDARGGAALSVRDVTGVPIIFASVGEGLKQLEPFHPDRMAGRILGMGDVLTLIEKAESEIDEREALRLQQKIAQDSFNFEDFLAQLKQVQKMGPLEQIVKMIPGMGNVAKQLESVDPREFKRVEAMILSMTPAERKKPGIIDNSRRRRIAKGSGMQQQDVGRLLNQFKEAKKMMRQLAKMGGIVPKGALGKMMGRK
ncbi:MAG: signal recognition particle protein [bacterium]|nr:signal recognition particle protein [bacterium]